MTEIGAFRFLYLNAYSFLLLILSLIIFFVPLYMVHLLFLCIQIPLGFVCLKTSVKLFASWKDKKRKYAVLLAKNKKEFREDSFIMFMQAPCGRLLVKAVLSDLNIPQKYKDLEKYKKTFFQSVKEGCAPQKTEVYINKDYL